MSISINLNMDHQVVAANSHYYKEPVKERYIDRTISNHDLIYLVDGSWSITENEQEYPLKKDDVLLLSAGRHHYTRFPCAPETRTFCIHVSCSLEDEAGMDSVLLPTRLSACDNPRIKQYFSDITTLFWQDVSYRERKLSSLVNLLFLELLSLAEESEPQTKDLAERAMERIATAPHIHYTCKTMAEQLFVSTKTLDQAMIQKTGQSFYAYQNQCKMEMAASLLRTEPDLHLREIAHALGFYDEFHLSKSFKQKYGISPREYRKQSLLP